MPIRDKIHPAAHSIVAKLVEHGHEAYLVGGAVRDLLLGIDPKDYDIATSALPEEVRHVFGRRRARIIGRRFRLVHVYENRDCYEVSTFRREPTPEERCDRQDDDGVMLWRDNVYGTLEEDARRRDFTVNSIYYDAIDAKGIVDFVGGHEDLQNRIVRAIGNPAERLSEDPVRLLRAIKLAAQYDFTIEDDLACAIRDQADRIALSSRARLLEELLKILEKPHCHATFATCREFGLLKPFWENVDSAWDGPVGDALQTMLRQRDAAISAGGYTNSKTLSMATLCLLSVTGRLRAQRPGDDGLWDYFPGIERQCRDEVCEFFLPFNIPRYLSARVRDIILMLPRFVGRRRASKLRTHPEYKYARELFRLWGVATGLDSEAIEFWPEPRPGPPRGEGGGERSGKRPRRSRRSHGRRRAQ